MTLQQLRLLREIGRQSLNLSRAADALGTSQPGVSRQLQLLEAELGIELLIRRHNRIAGFTPAGQTILAAAERLLVEAENIRSIAREFGNGGGRFTVATSHLHARYTLLEPIRIFVARHPEIRLHMLQADPDDILRLVERGEVDIGISTETSDSHPELAFTAARIVSRSLIMPHGHPLAAMEGPGLADIARFPVIGYTGRSRGGQIIARTFEQAGVAVSPVVSAVDADVIKAYVARGLGVGIVPTLALEAEADRDLHAIEVTGLFPKSAVTISLRRAVHVPVYLADFIRSIAPDWHPRRRAA